MPICEFLCRDCNRVFNFLARTKAAARRRPKCPRCHGPNMSRMISRFAVRRKEASPAGQPRAEGAKADAEPVPEEDAAIERAMAELARDFENIDEGNPRQVAAAMRRLSAATGEPLDPAMEEAVRRLEAGENPEKVEEAMADAFPEGAASDSSGTMTHDGGLYDL